MAKIPPVEELRKKYADEMADESVTKLSNWKDSNAEEPSDDEAYVQRAADNADALNKKLKEAMSLG